MSMKNTIFEAKNNFHQMYYDVQNIDMVQKHDGNNGKF